MEVWRIWFFVLIGFISLVSFTVADELWSRYNTTLTPTYSGDDVNLSGDLNVSGSVVVYGILNTTINCAQISGGSDGNYCFDSTGNGTSSTGTFNTSYLNILGSDLTLTDGDTNRAYTTTEPQIIYVDNQVLQPTINFNYAGGDVTFLNNIWDDQKITLYFMSPVPTTYNLLGSDFNGLDGAVNRQYTASEPLYIIIDNQMLHPTINYNYAGGVITILNKLWNDQIITIYEK